MGIVQPAIPDLR